MNCEFKILWVEDETVWFEAQARTVKDFLNSHYLNTVITHKRGDPEERIDCTGNCFDLIIMDYKLLEGQKGSDVIACIRKNDVLTDILFYSSEIEKARVAVNPPLDGIYYVDRKNEEFTPKLQALILKIIKRSEDLIHLRGFVLDYSADFEVRIKALLNNIWEKIDAEKREHLNSKTHCLIKSIISRVNSNKENVERSSPLFLNAINHKYMLSHSDRLDLLQDCIKILKESHKFKPDESHIKFKSRYEKDISCYRNALGHKKVGDNMINVNNQEIPIDENLYQKMRKSLLEYDELISKIEAFVNAINIK